MINLTKRKAGNKEMNFLIGPVKLLMFR